VDPLNFTWQNCTQFFGAGGHGNREPLKAHHCFKTAAEALSNNIPSNSYKPNPPLKARAARVSRSAAQNCSLPIVIAPRGAGVPDWRGWGLEQNGSKLADGIEFSHGNRIRNRPFAALPNGGGDAPNEKSPPHGGVALAVRAQGQRPAGNSDSMDSSIPDGASGI